MFLMLVGFCTEICIVGGCVIGEDWGLSHVLVDDALFDDVTFGKTPLWSLGGRIGEPMSSFSQVGCIGCVKCWPETRDTQHTLH